MEYVSIDGVRHACPFAELFPALTEDESVYLRQSIGELGIQNPIITYDSPAFGPALIQGRNRLRFGEMFGVKVPRNHLGAISDVVAQKLAYDVQSAGRQLSAAQVERARRDRTTRVAEMASQGMSTRTIADKLGTSQATVQRAKSSNAPSGDSGESPEPKSDYRTASSTVQGRDGKQYHQAPKAKPLPSDEDLEAFAEACVKRAGALIDRLQGELDSILAGPLANAFRAGAKAKKQPIPADVGKWFPLALIRHALSATQ